MSQAIVNANPNGGNNRVPSNYPPSGGGGVPGGSTGVSTAPFGENGGFAATQFLLFMPTQPANGGTSYIGIFDATNYNDPMDPSSYSYRMEDITVGRYPVVRRLFVVYRDLGLVTVTFTVSATNDNAQGISASETVTLGNKNATDTLMSKFVDIVLTGFRPQVSHSRAPNAGPLSIVSVTVIGEVEDTSL